MPTGAPLSLNHAAYLTFDTAATRDFYTRVLGCRLVAAVQEDRVPSTGEETPFLHLFFAFEDGSCIAFFDIAGLAPGQPDGLPGWARHFALNVATHDDLHAWKDRLAAAGVDALGPVDHHGIWHSLYFFDPNGIRLELTYQARALDDDDARSAEKMVEQWVASGLSRE